MKILDAISVLVLGYVIEEGVVSETSKRIQRIADKVTKKPGEAGFDEEVQAVDSELSEQGGRALMMTFGQITAIPEPRKPKIKCVAKGIRIEQVSPSGKYYAFGEVWVAAVLAAKGIALNEGNREKLNMHGHHVGVADPEKMSARELCSAIAATQTE